MNLTAGIAAVIALTIYAPVHAGMVTTSRQVPLAGTVFVSLSNGSLDGVGLTGTAQVVTQVATPTDPIHPTDPVLINVNLDQVAGVGDLTGFRYVGTGMNLINLPTIPGDPMNLGFDLLAVELPPDPVLPTDPVFPSDPVMPLDISFRLFINPDTGVLTNVIIESMSVPVP
jgi:hypothetical protein